MARKRPRLSDVADEVSKLGHTESAPTAVQDRLQPEPAADLRDEAYWRKFTALYRAAQLGQLDVLLGRMAAERHIKVSSSEIMRLALDEIIGRLETDPDRVLLDLHGQEKRELKAAPSRKFGRTRGIAAYLRRKGLL